MKKSQTEVPLTIAGAIGEADKILGPNRIWIPVNKKQKFFAERLFRQGRIDAKKIKEIESIASHSSDEINRFLKEHGSGASISQLARDEIGIASIMDLMVEWVRKGSNVDIEAQDKKIYKGVRIGKDGAGFYSSGKHNHPIACLATKTEDLVYLTMLDDEDSKYVPGEFSLHKKIGAMMRDIDICTDYGGIRFPKVDLDQEEDMDWLIGISTTSSRGDPAMISFAYQKNRLRMNEIGARFQSEFRGMIVLGAVAHKQKPDYIVDRPFLCWITRKGVEGPLFAAYVTEKDWKDPGNINH